MAPRWAPVDWRLIRSSRGPGLVPSLHAISPAADPGAPRPTLTNVSTTRAAWISSLVCASDEHRPQFRYTISSACRVPRAQELIRLLGPFCCAHRASKGDERTTSLLLYRAGREEEYAVRRDRTHGNAIKTQEWAAREERTQITGWVYPVAKNNCNCFGSSKKPRYLSCLSVSDMKRGCAQWADATRKLKN